MKIVLRSHNLNSSGRLKNFDEITLSDFKVGMRRFYLAHKIIFVYKNRVKVMKDRGLTAK